MKKIRPRITLMKVKLFTVILLGLAMVAMTMGISLAQEGEPKYGGTLRFVDWGAVAGFDVIKSRSPFGMGADAGHRVMETLFDQGHDGKLIPVLGLSATPSADCKIWTIKLIKGVKFHDGTPFNADAVVSHWQRILNPENRLYFH